MQAHVSHNIDLLMRDRGMSQADLALALGIKQPGVSERLRGITPWRIPEIEAVARILGCRSDSLLGPTSELPWGGGSGYPHQRPVRNRRPRKAKLPRLDSNQQPAGYRPAHPRVLLVA